MTAKTPAQRKADERARKRASGLVEVTVWVPSAKARTLRDYVRIYVRKPGEKK